jgi:hypothetical protein
MVVALVVQVNPNFPVSLPGENLEVRLELAFERTEVDE